MKGIICYYSGSGNTKLACEYIKKNVKNCDFELYDIVKTKIPDFSKYDFIGFATYADYGGAPQYMHNFFDQIDSQSNKYSFIFNTHGSVSGHTLKDIESLASDKGFNVLIGHSLHTPESFVPMRAVNITFGKSPSTKELNNFNNFIKKLDIIVEDISLNKPPKPEKIKISLASKLFPKFTRNEARKYMGKKFVDESLCNECGLCRDGCPYSAIKLKPKPVFDENKCYGCFRCYNRCPQKAIYTQKLKNKGHYPEPSEKLKNKLS